MTKLDHALRGVQRLGVDTAPVIYFIESNPRYEALVTEIFQRISNGVIEGLCSVITLTEVLVQPLRQGDQQVAQDYTDLLLHSRHFATVSIDPVIATAASALQPAHARCAANRRGNGKRLPSVSDQRYSTQASYRNPSPGAR